MSQEFNARADSALDHGWRVRDKVTGLAVDVRPGFPDFVIPDGNPNVPVETYSDNTVFGRLYRSAEDQSWRYGPNVQVPFNNGESLTNADTVLWYEGFLPHSSADGSALWHSTGIRLQARLEGTPPPQAPPGPTGTRTYAGGPVTIADNGPALPYPSTIAVDDLGGSISKVTVRLDGLSHTYPDDLDIALVAPGGQAIMLVSDAGGSGDMNGVTLTFDSAAAASLSTSAQIKSGTWRPTNYGTTDTLPAPAPAPASVYGTSLDSLVGLPARGNWSLYVLDDSSSDVGTLAGWTLTLATE
jgi:subtilisin-like proprotein convertase family protein